MYGGRQQVVIRETQTARTARLDSLQRICGALQHRRELRTVTAMQNLFSTESP